MNKITITKHIPELAHFDSLEFNESEETPYNDELHNLLGGLAITDSLNSHMWLDTYMGTTSNKYVLTFADTPEMKSYFDLMQSEALNPVELERIADKLANSFLAFTRIAESPKTIGAHARAAARRRNPNLDLDKGDSIDYKDLYDSTIDALGGERGDDLDMLLTSMGRD